MADFVATEFLHFRRSHVVHVGDVEQHVPSIAAATESEQAGTSIAVRETAMRQQLYDLGGFCHVGPLCGSPVPYVGA